MKRRCLISFLLCAVIACGIPVIPAADAGPVKWGGYSQNRFMMFEGGPNVARIERLSLNAFTQISPTTSAYFELYHHPALPDAKVFDQYRFYVESLYLDVKQPNNDTLRIGKGRRQTFAMTPTYPVRKTSNYGITSSAFTQSRVMGVQYFGKQDEIDYGVGVISALRLGNASIGDAKIEPSKRVNNIADKDVPNDITSNLELSGRVGRALPDGTRYGVTGLYSRLDDTDLAFMQANFPGNPTSKHRSRYGAYFLVPRGDYVVQGEYFKAKSSDVSHDNWYVTAGYNPAPPKMRAYVRYAQVGMGGPTTANKYTWDKQELTFSIVKPLQKKMWLQLEYEINTESPPPGVPKVKNNLLFLELFTGF